MKPFLRQVVLFAMIPLSLIVMSFFLADGTIDPFYLKFTTPKKANIIVGTSRAAQGVLPQVLDSVLQQKGIHSNFLNYSFTLAHSPFGPVYFNAIKRKLDETTKDGIFVITVDPWSISSATKDANDSADFKENQLCLATTKKVNSNPNIDYLLNSYNEPILSIYTDKIKNLFREPTTVLHNDGWLEIKVSMDSLERETRLRKRLEDYQLHFVPYYHFSTLRLAYLKKTIQILQSHGKVYLVRLPVSASIRKMDDDLMPDFNEQMEELAAEDHVHYINYMPDANKYQYVDGTHLYKNSGRDLSKQLADDIVKFD